MGAVVSLWYRTLYRPVMRLLHRLDLHYAPTYGPILPDHSYQQWCRWCGLRMRLPPPQAPVKEE